MALSEFHLEIELNWPGISHIYWSNNGHGNGLFIVQYIEHPTEYFIWGLTDIGLISAQIIKDFNTPVIAIDSIDKELCQISGPHPTLDSAKVAYRMLLVKYNGN